MSAILIEKRRFPNASTERLDASTKGLITTFRRKDPSTVTSVEQNRFCNPNSSFFAWVQLTDEEFGRALSEDPDSATDYLIQQVSHRGSRLRAIKMVLPYVARAGYGTQNLLIAALRRLAAPHELIRAAVEINRLRNDHEMLKATAGLLEHYGPEAWTALMNLARSDQPECSYFARQIAECDGIPEEHRQKALMDLATNSDLDTRWEVIEILDGGCLSDPTPVWKVLNVDIDERIRSIAGSRLELLTT